MRYEVPSLLELVEALLQPVLSRDQREPQRRPREDDSRKATKGSPALRILKNAL